MKIAATPCTGGRTDLRNVFRIKEIGRNAEAESELRQFDAIALKDPYKSVTTWAQLSPVSALY